MHIDELIARLDGAKIDMAKVVDVAAMDNWAVACLIGQTVSLALNGYEDTFDAIDWEDAARELRYSATQEGETFTRASILKALDKMGYCLEDYA